MKKNKFQKYTFWSAQQRTLEKNQSAVKGLITDTL